MTYRALWREFLYAAHARQHNRALEQRLEVELDFKAAFAQQATQATQLQHDRTYHTEVVS